MPIYNVDLNTSSVSRLINNLKLYQKGLVGKNALFVQRLAELGIPIIDSTMARTRGDANPRHDTEISIAQIGGVVKGTLTLSGEDILFFEFGAGIYYNATDPAHASKFGYGVGTYPGQTHAFDDGGWWYTDDAGVSHHSYGTEATSPMLRASHEMIVNIRRIAREVYGI